MANKDWLSSKVFEGRPQPLPSEIAHEMENLPDDQALFEFIQDIITVTVAVGGNIRLAAGCIASGLLDLGFKR